MVLFIPEVTSIRFMWHVSGRSPFSAFLSVLAIVLFIHHEHESRSIDFRGGSMLEVQARDQQADAADVRGPPDGS